ncbi:hypothetical protein [Novosphingobium mangrovi (ex Huang et al. 2023)]|uniref:Uncharacterized protein n=1 Tax=Novosphingobium mangrovi (ex Huang et al. 2023) TaxID=2976432 RepID=A0ABT2I9H2_9SPHN|nr:hypothetical protein [Novosphingobium mangrovi (ex Huang et al. 2023)]MCT2401157.1 hypothetical protein [Novosphingobium mangrovi (ex Huang et al. 2023)]
MKKSVGTIAPALIAAAALLAAPAVQAKPKLTGEEQLAKMLEGREAGKPVNCIPLSQATDTTVIEKTAIVYRIGSTLYVNRPTNADLLDDDDILVTRLYGSQLCSVDTVQLHDRSGSHMWSGFVGLREFVPYKKVKKESGN